MKRKKLEQLRGECDRLRRHPNPASAFTALASQLGRKLVKRGKHPTWESTEFDHLYPLSIPSHGGKDIPIGTARSIVNALEEDLLAWEGRLSEQENVEE